MQRRAGATARNVQHLLSSWRRWVSLVALWVIAAWGCSTPPNAGPDAPTQGTLPPQATTSADPDAAASASGGDAGAAVSAGAQAGKQTLRPLVDAARAAVAQAFEDADPRNDQLKLRAFIDVALEDAATAPTTFAALRAAFKPDPDSFADRARVVRLALGEGALAEAKAAAWAAAEAAAAAGRDEDRKAFIKWWYEGFARDPVFMPPTTLTLEEGTEGAQLSKLAVMSREGTSILFKAKRGDTTVGVLKPMQRLWLSNYRGEIAAYRLCPLIHCGFTMPHNQEARIDKATFNKIHAEDKDWMENRKGKGIVLVWFKDDGKEYLYGTYKSWEPGFALFPIEDSPLWEDALKVDGTPLDTLKDQSFEAFMKPFAKKHEKKYKGMLERADGLTTMAFLRQLSNLHVFDALTNNWDRYTGQPYPGLNCQFNNGQFMSIDNGATFQTKKDQTEHADYYGNAGRRLRGRIGRYSRSTINALRWMDDEAIRALLFPPSAHHTDEDERFELFIERRDAILKHVDKLIATHGEDKVLVFP